MLQANANSWHHRERAQSQIDRHPAQESDPPVWNVPRPLKLSRWGYPAQAWKHIQTLPGPAENCWYAGSTTHASHAQWMNLVPDSWQIQDHAQLRPCLSAGAP